MTQDIHSMELEEVHETGAETWTCPICDRSFVVVWHPHKKIVLRQGDTGVVHSGQKGNDSLVMSAPEMTQPISNPWIETIEGLDFGDDDEL